MKPMEVKELLMKTIPAKLPVLITGPPGVGKSDIIRQAAEAVGAEIIVSHPVVSAPIDFKGLPAIINGRAEFKPYGGLRRLLEAKKLTVAFLDDLGQAPVTVQAAAMQLVLGRQVNGHRVSDEVVFMAATNRHEDKAGVTMFLEPLKSRFVTIIELEVSIDDWCLWAADEGMPPEVIGFIRFRPELLMDKRPPTKDIKKRPCPRSVAHVGTLLNAGIIDFDVLAGAVGKEWVMEFMGFRELCKQLPRISDIFHSPQKTRIPEEKAVGALYALTAALVQHIKNKKQAAAAIRYMRRLPVEFQVLFIKDAVKHIDWFPTVNEFTQWAVKHADVFTA